MKILFISNQSGERCGVAEFGRTMLAELQSRGVPVTGFDGDYSSIYAHHHQYFPDDIDQYDWIHFNWHPVTLNHYQLNLLPLDVWQSVRISVYLHDLPPWSSCALTQVATACFSSEPAPNTICLPYPAIEDAVCVQPILRPVTIGWSGVRGDGQQAVAEICKRRGWTLNDGGGVWRGTREEITRLSRSTVNVLWYTATGRGKSLALMTAAAARRPLLINDSSMFDAAWGYQDEIYRAGRDPVVPYLEQAIDAVLHDVWNGCAKVPESFVTDFGWTHAVERLRAVWGC